MDDDTSLAKGIRSIDDEYDAACKRLLSERQVLARIMHEWVGGFADASVRDIERECFEGDPLIGEEPVERDEHAEWSRVRGLVSEDATVEERTVTFDIRYVARVPGGGSVAVEVDVEAQRDYHPGYPILKRGIYYAARLLSMQGSNVVKESHYERLRRVCSIWVCTKPSVRNAGSVTRFRLTGEDLEGHATYRRRDYDLVEVIVVCLGTEEERGALGMLGVLLSERMSPEEKIGALERDYGMIMTEDIRGEVRDMCNLSMGIRQEGRKEGRKEGRVDDARNLMTNLGLGLEEALDALGIRGEERDEVASELAGRDAA